MFSLVESREADSPALDRAPSLLALLQRRRTMIMRPFVFFSALFFMLLSPAGALRAQQQDNRRQLGVRFFSICASLPCFDARCSKSGWATIATPGGRICSRHRQTVEDRDCRNRASNIGVCTYETLDPGFARRHCSCGVIACLRGRQNYRSGPRRLRRWFRMEASGGYSPESRLLGTSCSAA